MRAILVRCLKHIFSLFGFRIVRIDVSKDKIISDHLDLELFFDVGANIGQYVKQIRKQGYKNQVVSFEPLSIEHNQLQLIASKDENWQIFDRCAIGNVSGPAIVNISKNSFSSSISGILQSHVEAAPDSIYIGSESVDVYRLSDVYKSNFGQYQRIGLKIDVQGFEMEVLRGAREIFDLIHFIQVELSTVPVYTDQSLYFEIDKFLREANFNLWKIIPGFSHPMSGQMLQFDAIYVK